jgi:hypothetical protein
MAVLRSVVKIAINHFGYDVRRVATPARADVAVSGMDPVTFEYLPHRRGHAIVSVPLADVRAFHALGLRLEAQHHPFVRAISAALQDERASRDAIADVLREYYQKVCPASAADVLGLPADEIPGLRGFAPNSDDHPIDVDVLPWSGRSPAEIKEGRRRTAVYEGLQNGVFARAEEGVTSFGPVKDSKLILEIDRLSRLFESVKASGFRRFEPRAPLQVAAFRRDGEYRWVINSGQHRFATAAAFGLETLPAMVTQVIRRDDAALWPQVVSGVFTEHGAATVFDRIFDGVPAPICHDWIESGAHHQETTPARDPLREI